MNAKPGKVRINKVKDRILFLSPSVKLGHENEATLKDFDIGDMLGSGAFGQVYKVTHKISKRVFALKVIEKAKIKKNKMENQIQNEVKIMYSLDNEHIVRLFNHFEDEQNIYLVMEFAEEGQLMNKLKKAPGRKLGENVAAAYIRDLVKALDYIHNLSPPIIHRDIKPENLLVGAGNRIKLGDFGWSNYNEDSRTTYCGTPEYLAPEMLLQKGHSDKLDIWCVGVLVFELLTGKTPFLPRKPLKDANEMDRALKKGIVEGKPVIPSEFPALARDLVSKLLKTNPRERLSLTEIKKHPWFKQNGITFGDDLASLSSSGLMSSPAKPNLAASLLTISEKEEFRSLQVSGVELPEPGDWGRGPLEFEMEDRALAESELPQLMPDLSNHEASLFFRRESVLAPADLPALDGLRLAGDRRSVVERVADSFRRSVGLKSGEQLAKLKDDLDEKKRRIADLQALVEGLELDKARLKGELDKARAGQSFTTDDLSFTSVTVPSFESKLTRLVEEERDKLRLKVEELYKLVSRKEEAIDLLTGKVTTCK
jgi:serine/threonine protein kinase